jgi:predicted Fe-Mo cluster-binding NifX family protein
MKILLTTTSPGLDAPIDPRFGRCAFLTVVDLDTLEWQSHSNPGLNASGGAGTHTAQFVATQNISAVISRNFGPNAFEALQTAGVDAYICAEECTAREAIAYFQEGRMHLSEQPTNPGHNE